MANSFIEVYWAGTFAVAVRLWLELQAGCAGCYRAKENFTLKTNRLKLEKAKKAKNIIKFYFQ
jgi:hypothetical protein